MSAAVRLGLDALAILGILTALGIGPALLLGQRIRSAALMAPALGFAISAAVLVSLSYEITMATAAWLAVMPLAACSVVIAFVVARRRRIDMRELAIPIGISLLGLALGCLPGFLLSTTGPTTLMVLDAWGYIPADFWLQHHTANAPLPHSALRSDLTAYDGHYWMGTGGDTRIGSMVVGGAIASLLRTTPDQINLALLSVLYALGPLSIWLLARTARVGRLAAGIGATFGLSPALLMLVFDGTEANLIGLALSPLALLLIVRAAISGSLREAILAATFAAGLIASYPEYLLPYGLVAGLGIGAAALGEGIWRSAPVRRIGLVILRAAGIGLAALAATPVATQRMFAFLPNVRNAALTSDLPDRGLTLKNFGSWAFGILDLYQLPRFEALSPAKTALAIGLPIILTVIIVFGLTKRIDTERAVIAAGLLVPLPLGLYVYGQFQDGHCQYCMWKSFTFMLPFLGAGIALGTDRIVALASKFTPGMRRTTAAAPFVAIAIISVAALGNANVKVIQATHESATYFPTSLRQVVSEAKTIVPHSANMLIEGSDAEHNPIYGTSTMYFAAHAINEPRLSFDVVPIATYELGAPLGPDAYYSPRYDYVLTAFAGLNNGRKVLARRSHFALERRAPVDVAMTRTGWALDPHEGSAAIPWVSTTFTLRVSSAGNAQVAVTVGIRRPLHDHPRLQFLDTRGRAQRTFFSADGSRFCTVAHISHGQATVGVQPSFDQVPPFAGRATELDPLPPPPKAVGIATVRGRVGRCPTSFRAQPASVVYGGGWFPSESEPPLRYRWMGTEAVVTVGEVGESRKKMTLESSVTSNAVPRRLTVSLAGRVIARIVAPANARLPFSIHLPAGTGTARLILQASPPAAPATQITPGDRRVLAVRLREFSPQG